MDRDSAVEAGAGADPVAGDADGAPGPVARAVGILGVIAEAEGDLTLSEIATAVGLPRPSAHRQLRVLRDLGLVGHDSETRRYGRGPELYRLAALVMGKHRVVDLATPFMEALVEETGESSVLGLYHPEGPHMVYAYQVPSKHPLGYRIELNKASSLLWGATGRAMLAFLPEVEREKAIAQGDPAPGDGMGLDQARLRRSLRKIREQGYAHTHGHKIPGAHAIAAPLLGSAGRVVGSLSITIPEVRFDSGHEGALAVNVKKTAEILSELLGSEQGIGK